MGNGAPGSPLAFCGITATIRQKARVPIWVKLRKTQCEHKFSELPPIADIDVWHLRDCCKVWGGLIGVVLSRPVRSQRPKVERSPTATARDGADAEPLLRRQLASKMTRFCPDGRAR
jgi:hypothetical protein